MTEKRIDALIPTGFFELDTMLSGGLPRGVVTMLTSPLTAEGKTSFGVSILRHMCQQSKMRSVLFTIEGSHRAIGYKLLAMETGIDTTDMRRGSLTDDDERRLQESSHGIQQWPLWIDEEAIRSVTMIREHLAKIFGTDYPDFIIIDYLDLMDVGEYHAKLTGLRLLAREAHAAILVVSHTIEERLTQEIMMQHAPTLLVLNREDHARQARLDVWQEKATRSLPLYFYPPTTRFFNSEEECRSTYQLV